MAGTIATRRQNLPWALPAVVLTTVAATLSAPPAMADERGGTRDIRPLLRGTSGASAAASTPSGAGSSATPASYAVVAGDTPYNIAQRFGLSVDALLSMNGLSWSSVIYPGDVLALTPALAPAPAEAAAPAPAAADYEVVAGDTLYAIASAHGITLDQLFAANGLGPDSIIYPGQALALSQPAPAPVAEPAPAAVPPELTEQWATLDAEQIANAQLIIAIGRELGVSDRGVAIALATAMVESWLRNLDWGDRDSLGLFQQRPSTGWGTPEQIMDPTRSIRVFYGGASDPNGATTTGLLDLEGWESMAFTDAAQAVQISAFPARYGTWEAQAHQWLTELG